jgi:hypothetical protein
VLLPLKDLNYTSFSYDVAALCCVKTLPAVELSRCRGEKQLHPAGECCSLVVFTVLGNIQFKAAFTRTHMYDMPYVLSAVSHLRARRRLFSHVGYSRVDKT